MMQLHHASYFKKGPAQRVGNGGRESVHLASRGPAGSVAKFVWIGEFSALDGVRSWRMNDFKGRHFGGEIVLWAVRW